MSNRELIIASDVGERVKACIYKAGDVGIVPCEGGVLFMDPGDPPKHWTPAPAEEAKAFHVKYFRPELVDKFLAGADGVALGSTVTLHESHGTYNVTVRH